MVLTPQTLRIVALVVLTAVLAGAVRLVGLTRESLFVDETFSARFSSLEVDRILDLTARDIHPPLYYLGLASWRGFLGDTVWDLRAYSVLWSLIGVGALALLMRDLACISHQLPATAVDAPHPAMFSRFGVLDVLSSTTPRPSGRKPRWARHLAALATKPGEKCRLAGGKGALLVVIALAVVHPLDVYFAQTARMYSQLAALSTLAAWLLWRWMISVVDEDRISSWSKWAVAYAVTAVFLLYTHYLGVVMLVAQGVFALGYFGYTRRWSCLGGYLVCASVSATAFVPWLVRVLGFRDELYSQRHLVWMPSAGINDGVGILFRELMWGRVPLRAPWTSLTYIAAFFIVVGAAFLLVRSIVRPAIQTDSSTFLDRLRLGYPLWLLVGPVAIAILVSGLYHPIYFPPRFALLVLPPFLILLGRAFEELGSFRWRWFVAVLVFVLVAASTVVQSAVISRIHVDGFVELWRSKGQPAAVVFFPSHTDRIASYYLGERIRSAMREDVDVLVATGASDSIWVCTTRNWRPRSRADREFRKWLLALGPRHSLVRTDDLEVVQLQLGRTGITPIQQTNIADRQIADR